MRGLYSPRLKTVPKIEIQLKTTASAQPVNPMKNITSTKRIIQTEKVYAISADDASHVWIELNTIHWYSVPCVKSRFFNPGTRYCDGFQRRIGLRAA